MSVNVKTFLKSPLQVGACLTATVTLVGTVYALTHPRSMVKRAESAQLIQANRCTTVVFDDQPPLNVRQAPNDRSGTIVGALDNGEVLTVVGEQNGWLRITAPTVGWVYENRTRKTCEGDPPDATLTRKQVNDPVLATLPNEPGTQLYREAISQYQSGNLTGAIALLRSISADSAAYEPAQIALKTMPQTWNQAKAKYNTALAAQEQRRWGDVIVIATDYPDIRHWREKLAPIVKKATRMHHFTTNKAMQ
ncbi:bacterial SH3 domain family protein [Leptolyngbya sp. NIES-3755]|nr:bacterial SH3 domain family protein [Leptolyngbya sp. NIES-3755]